MSGERHRAQRWEYTHIAPREDLLQAELELALDLDRRIHRDHAPWLRLDLVPRLQAEVEHAVAVAVINLELRALNLPRGRRAAGLSRG